MKIKLNKDEIRRNTQKINTNKSRHTYFYSIDVHQWTRFQHSVVSHLSQNQLLEASTVRSQHNLRILNFHENTMLNHVCKSYP